MATWPTAVATDANLYLAVNELQTNLSAGINNAVTTIGLNSTTSFPTVGLVLIDNEVIKYTGVSGGNLTGCTRGFDGTSAASHSSAAVVSFAIMAAHHNSLKDEIEAIEATLRDLVGLSATLPLTVSVPVKTDASGHLTTGTITLTSDVGGILPVANGGTNSSTVLANGKVMISSGGKIVEGSVTTTTLAFLDATSSIQTQLNTKQATLTAGQLPGTATNDNASAGNTGEYVSADMANVNFPTSTQWGDLTSISLSAGDWDVRIQGIYANNTATPNFADVGISSTTGNSSTGLTLGTTYMELGSGIVTGSNVQAVPGVVVRFSLASPATIYAKGRASYSGGPPQYSGRIQARRAR